MFQADYRISNPRSNVGIRIVTKEAWDCGAPCLPNAAKRRESMAFEVISHRAEWSADIAPAKIEGTTGFEGGDGGLLQR